MMLVSIAYLMILLPQQQYHFSLFQVDANLVITIHFLHLLLPHNEDEGNGV